jgi:DNA-binding response OmpR family regulator
MPQEIGVDSSVVEVLLVDDHPQLRKLLVNLLSRDRSYHVVTASSGEEALEVSRNRSERIDLLITDIDMGQMSGIELYRHVRKERPETEVLFISALAHRVREVLPECPLLEKPFSPRQFVAKVTEVLSRANDRLEYPTLCYRGPDGNEKRTACCGLYSVRCLFLRRGFH